MTTQRDPGLKCLTLTFNLDNVGRSVAGPRPKTRNVNRSQFFDPKQPFKSTSRLTPRNSASNFYQRKLNTDINRLLLDDEPVKNPPPPKLYRPSNKPSSASNGIKSEHHREYLRIAQSLSHNSTNLLTSRASSSVAPQSFLIDDLQNKPCSELGDKLGRPTRTTLLRNRQRSNSAPISTYETREEIKRRNQILLDQRSRPSTASNKDAQIVSEDIMEGESLHAFLTGARYNRAHYVDAKSLLKFGVYMPRGNPRACFVNENKLRHSQQDDQTPPAPPESPVESEDEDPDEVLLDDTETPAPPCTPAPRPSSTPEPPQGPPPPAQQADKPEPSLPPTGRPRSAKFSTRQAWSENMTIHELDHHTDHSHDRHQHSNASRSVSTGPKLNITGRKVNFGGVPKANSTHGYHYDAESVPPPPPSVDFNTRLDLYGFSANSRTLRSNPDHSRSVRFSEPDEFNVLGRAISSPKSSPKTSPQHSRSILKSEMAVKESFFMTEALDAEATKNDDEKVENGHDEVTKPEESKENTDQPVNGETLGDKDDKSIGMDTKENEVLEEENIEVDEKEESDSAMLNLMGDLGAQWMEEAGVDLPVEDNPEEDGTTENPDEEDRADTPMHIIAVDIARRTIQSAYDESDS